MTLPLHIFHLFLYHLLECNETEHQTRLRVCIQLNQLNNTKSMNAIVHRIDQLRLEIEMHQKKIVCIHTNQMINSNIFSLKMIR